MSRQQKRKHVMNEALWADYQLPGRNQYIVKVLRSMGNNLHMVITPGREEFLVSMPPKFRKVIWIKRKDYLLVEQIPEGNRVRAEIVKVLNKESIRFYKQQNVWPKEFDEDRKDFIELFENIHINAEGIIDYSTESSDESSCDSGISDDDMFYAEHYSYSRNR